MGEGNKLTRLKTELRNEIKEEHDQSLASQVEIKDQLAKILEFMEIHSSKHQDLELSSIHSNGKAPIDDQGHSSFGRNS